MKIQITTSQVQHIADLANIPISKAEQTSLAQAFDQTLEVIDNLKKVDVTGVEPTHQVTGLENVFRQDEVNESVMFSQQEALKNGNLTHEGYFVVERIIDES